MIEHLPETAFLASPHATLLIDPGQNKILAANNQACKFLEQDVFGLQAIPISAFFSTTLPDWLIFTDEVLTQGSAWSDALSFTIADGRCIRMEVLAKRITLGETEGMVCSFQEADMLEQLRERSEAQRIYMSGIGHWNRVAKVFKEFERENHLILEAAGEGIYGIDANGNTTFLNPAAERMLGWKTEELFGKNIHQAVHHSHRDGCHYDVADCPIYQAFKDGRKRNVDNEVFWTKAGKAIDVEYTSTPIVDNGMLAGAVVIFRDVTQKRIDQRRLLDALSEVERLKNRLEMEKAYLQEEISEEFNHHQIIGKSTAVQLLIQKITMVAPTDATTLIFGQSGTGKELIARAIHDLSDRRGKPLIRVNCAAIPADLFESEFFGHSKGAFTGATLPRIGRFELADGGTLFLDEVGEIPLPLQGKLLRVLQEQQFERVGESRTRTVDVRIIVATNKELKNCVKEGSFREDLYFRLNVFPIESVPLCERIEDIPLLAQHFLRRAATKINKPHLKLSLTQLERLQHYSWPGNIRELENVIERQVILAQGDQVVFNDLPVDFETELPIPKKLDAPEVITDSQLKQQQKQTIHIALKHSKGKVFGKNGAAELLDLRPTTLSSRIKKYGIDINEYKCLQE